MLDKLRGSDFLPYLHQAFVIRLEGIEPITLELVEVVDLPYPHAPEQRGPFSLTFLGPVSMEYLPQATYRLEHAQLGALDIFIVPLGLKEGRMQYQAIFN